MSTAAVLGCASLVAVSGASASPMPAPPQPVAANLIEHSIVRVDATTSSTSMAPRHDVVETWQSSDRSRSITLTDGQLQMETVWGPELRSSFHAPSNTVYLGEGGAPDPSWASRGITFRQLEAQGALHLVATITGSNGQPADVLESVAGKWQGDQPGTSTRIVIDAENDVPLEISVERPTDAFKQTETLVDYDSLSRTAERESLLVAADHPGAKVVNVDGVNPAAAKTAQACSSRPRVGRRYTVRSRTYLTREPGRVVIDTLRPGSRVTVVKLTSTKRYAKVKHAAKRATVTGWVKATHLC